MNYLDTALAEADPATTPRDAPLRPEALDLLAQIVATPVAVVASVAPRARPHRSRLVLGAGIAVLLLVVTVFAVSQLRLVPGGQNTADYPWYATQSQLADAADAIIAGQVLSEREEVKDGIDYVITTVRVNATAKGKLNAGERIEVKYPASEPPVVCLEPGEMVILFLAVYSDAPASLLNPAQASYLITPEGIETSPDNPIRLTGDLLDQLGIAG